MSRILSILGGVTLGMALSIAGYHYVSNPFAICGYEDVEEFRNDRYGVSVIVSVVNCGATTDYNTALYYKPTAGPVDREQSFFLVKGKKDVAVRWDVPATLNENLGLTVEYDQSDFVFRQAIKWNGMSIRYSER